METCKDRRMHCRPCCEGVPRALEPKLTLALMSFRRRSAPALRRCRPLPLTGTQLVSPDGRWPSPPQPCHPSLPARVRGHERTLVAAAAAAPTRSMMTEWAAPTRRTCVFAQPAEAGPRQTAREPPPPGATARAPFGQQDDWPHCLLERTVRTLLGENTNISLRLRGGKAERHKRTDYTTGRTGPCHHCVLAIIL
jgi:hypothetical protein